MTNNKTQKKKRVLLIHEYDEQEVSSMTDVELAELMNENKADLEYLEELTDSLREEMAKPKEERNYEAINELTEAISVICGSEQYFSERTDEGVSRLKQNLDNSGKTKKRRFILRRLVPAVAAAIIVTANVYSYSVFGMNAFSSTIRIFDGSIQISYNNADNDSIQISYNNTDDDQTENPYSQQMLEKCQEAGFTPLVPNYLPPNMKPADIWGETHNERSIPDIRFELSGENNKLIFQFINVSGAQNGFELGMPMKTHDISEETIAGVTVYFIKKTSTEFHVSFKKEQIVYNISSDGIQEDEFRKILNSMFEK